MVLASVIAARLVVMAIRNLLTVTPPLHFDEFVSEASVRLTSVKIASSLSLLFSLSKICRLRSSHFLGRQDAQQHVRTTETRDKECNDNEDKPPSTPSQKMVQLRER
jgi:hypothetical protein